MRQVGTRGLKATAASLPRSLAFVLILAAGLPAQADMATALALCLDQSLDIDARADAFEAAGWTRSDDRELADDALFHGVLISGLAPENPSVWAESQERAARIAENLRAARGHDEVRLVVNGDEAVVIEPSRSGLATCLYVGPPDDLAAAEAVMPDQPLYHIGARRTIRGTPPYGQLIVYAMDEDAIDDFPVPLRFASTFTSVLDRRDRP